MRIDDEPKPRSPARIVTMIVLGYLTYAAAAVAFESYACHRFDVQRRTVKPASKVAWVQQMTARREKESWLPYTLVHGLAVTVWTLAGLATGVATYRTLRKRKGVTYFSTNMWALMVAMPSLFVMLVGVLPLELAPELWERYPLLTW